MRSCFARHTICDRPIPIPYEEVHLGNLYSHSSHKLMKYKEIVYCSKCGMRSQVKLVGLGHPCSPPTAYGLGTLKAIHEGRLPTLKRSASQPPPISRKKGETVGYVKKTKTPVGVPVAREQLTDKQLHDRWFGVDNSPSNVSSAIITSASSSSGADAIPPIPMEQILIDLLELAECGESVEWPSGYDIWSARQIRAAMPERPTAPPPAPQIDTDMDRSSMCSEEETPKVRIISGNVDISHILKMTKPKKHTIKPLGKFATLSYIEANKKKAADLLRSSSDDPQPSGDSSSSSTWMKK